MGPKGCTGTSESKYQITLLNIPEEWLITLSLLWRNPEIALVQVIMMAKD
jgi:hypothetical protein